MLKIAEVGFFVEAVSCLIPEFYCFFYKNWPDMGYSTPVCTHIIYANVMVFPFC